MPEIDGWADVVEESARDAWPILAKVTKRMGGSLIGGTALTIHLRHRRSFDLDYTTFKSFSGEQVVKALKRETSEVLVHSAEVDSVRCRVGQVEVQLFTPTPRNYTPGYKERVLETPVEVDGLPIASVPDLLAMKLDVIMYRPKLRDYIDLAAIDQMSPYSLEDGLMFHMKRYGSTPTTRDTSRIIDLLDYPGVLRADRVFEGEAEITLEYLRKRVPELRRYLHMEVRKASQSVSTPPDLPEKMGPTDQFTAAIQQVQADTSDKAYAPSICGHIGARNGKTCIRPPHDKGRHRYK